MTNFVNPAAMLPMQPTAMAGAYGEPVYVSSMAYPGAVPATQGMLGQALGLAGVPAQQTSTTSPLKSMLKFAAIGAGAGAAFGLIPFLPLGLFSGALVGAGVGAAIGLFKGLKAKKAEGEFHTMQQAQMAQMQGGQPQSMQTSPTNMVVPATYQGMPSANGAPAPAPAPAKTGVVMGPEMRRKWAAKVAAERAAAK